MTAVLVWLSQAHHPSRKWGNLSRTVVTNASVDVGRSRGGKMATPFVETPEVAADASTGWYIPGGRFGEEPAEQQQSVSD